MLEAGEKDSRSESVDFAESTLIPWSASVAASVLQRDSAAGGVCQHFELCGSSLICTITSKLCERNRIDELDGHAKQYRATVIYNDTRSTCTYQGCGLCLDAVSEWEKQRDGLEVHASVTDASAWHRSGVSRISRCNGSRTHCVLIRNVDTNKSIPGV